MMRVGWFRQVYVKSSESQHLRALLSNRRLLKRKFIDVENQVRGTLRAFGIKVGKVSRGKFEARTMELVEAAQPLLQDLVNGMLKVRRMLWTEYSRLHNMLIRIVRRDAICRHFMGVPGVGPVAALAFKTAVDDPHRFRRSRTVGTHFGLTPERFQSGTINYDGRITRCGDAEVRTALYEAANSLMAPSKKWSVSRAWGIGVVKRRRRKRAIVVAAHKLAMVLHRMWVDGTEFRWTRADGSHGGDMPAVVTAA